MKNILHIGDNFDESILKLVCLPHAGGSAQAYQSWRRAFPPEISLVAVQYPARGNRARDPMPCDAQALVGEIADALEDMIDEPYALYGHSMGAMMSYALAYEMKQRNWPAPLHMVVSASRAPQCPLERTPMHQLDDKAFIGELEKLGGTPTEILRNTALMKEMLPVLRADFRLLETYIPFAAPAPQHRIACAISVHGGSRDHVRKDQLEAWQACVNGPMRFTQWEGGHFFNTDHLPALAKEISATLFRRLSGAPAFTPLAGVSIHDL